jgi:hypothetical protein
MNYRTLIVAVTLVAVRLVVPFASAEPKAYDTVFYKGKAVGLKIVFEFDHGYVEASNVQDHGICQQENDEVLSVG